MPQWLLFQPSEFSLSLQAYMFLLYFLNRRTFRDSISRLYIKLHLFRKFTYLQKVCLHPHPANHQVLFILLLITINFCFQPPEFNSLQLFVEKINNFTRLCGKTEKIIALVTSHNLKQQDSDIAENRV